MKKTFMKRRYLFVAVVLLAAGLVFSGCDLIEPGNNDETTTGDEERYIIVGKAEEGKTVQTIFTVKKGIGRPMRDDGYVIWHDNESNVVSKGRIDIRGEVPTQTVMFIPDVGDNRFEAYLDITKNSLTFLRGILTYEGTIVMGYRDDGSGTEKKPVFDMPLDDKSITLNVGEKPAILTVLVKNNNGLETPYYQWYRSPQNSATTWTPIKNARDNFYAVPTSSVGTFNYCVKVGNATGGVITSNAKEVKVVASSEIFVGNGDGLVPLHNLKKAIETLLNTNSWGMAYTVIFADNLAYPLFINVDDFPGTGKLTIKSKSGLVLDKGFYITRSNVELDGLNIKITDRKNAALYYDPDSSDEHEPCAVLISDRYFWGSAYDKVTDYTGYRSYLNTDPAVKKVSILNCTIEFSASSGPNTGITGICVDPYTAGRNADTRILIDHTKVDVSNTSNGSNAQCFWGNNTDFTENIFKSTGKVAYIPFLFSLTYGDTITFLNNTFESSLKRGFEIHVNCAMTKEPVLYKTDTNLVFPDVLETVWSVCATFGTDEHKFGELPSKYRWFIENLFAQLKNPIGNVIEVADLHKNADWSDEAGQDKNRETTGYYIGKAIDSIEPVSINPPWHTP